MATHVKILGTIFLVVGVLCALAALASVLLFGGLASFAGVSGEEGAGVAAAVLGLTGAAFTIVLALFAVPSIACGLGLLKFKPWARILGIVLSAISLINLPIGTAIGIYGLWVLFRKDTEPLFAGQSG